MKSGVLPEGSVCAFAVVYLRQRCLKTACTAFDRGEEPSFETHRSSSCSDLAYVLLKMGEPQLLDSG